MADKVTITEHPRASLLLVKLWDEDQRAALAAALDLPLPDGPMQFRDADEGRVHALAPGEFVLENLGSHAQVVTRLADFPHTCSVTDLTAGRTRFRIAGPEVEWLLAGGCSLDLHTRTFSPGRCALTKFETIGVLIARIGNFEFDLMVDRAHAQTLLAMLERSRELGATGSNHVR